MTAAQLAAIESHINANLTTQIDGKTIATLLGESNFTRIAEWFNSNTTIDIWKPDLKAKELASAIVLGDYAALTTSKQNTFLMYITSGEVDATSANVQGILTGLFASGATRTNILAAAKKKATIFESLFISNDVSAVYGITVTGSDVLNSIQ